MGTRGAVGVVIDGELKITYNHFDSYPGGLGENVLEFIASHQSAWEPVREKARALQLVPETDAAPSGKEWYWELREIQGNLGAILDYGVMTDGTKFPLDSLFCEYAYIVNLDVETLEFYEGFQKEPHKEGRFASGEPIRNYYPCRLVGLWPLENAPSVEGLTSTSTRQ